VRDAGLGHNSQWDGRGQINLPPDDAAYVKVYMELGSYFLFRQEQIQDIIICGAHLRVTHG
jgi:hypothetical protein